jgi:Peptidase family M48
MTTITCKNFIQSIGSVGICEPALQNLQSAYEQAINSLIDKSVIPYYPNLYVVPFMIIKRYKVRFCVTRTLFYALTYPDVKDFDKFAIYLYEGLTQKVPDLLSGVIGHEISHVIASKGRVQLTKEDLALILKDRLDYISAKEKSAEEMYYYFVKEMQYNIKKWNTYSRRQETEDSITKDAELVDQEYFDKWIFGDRLEEYKQFVKFNLNKIGVL